MVGGGDGGEGAVGAGGAEGGGFGAGSEHPTDSAANRTHENSRTSPVYARRQKPVAGVAAEVLSRLGGREPDRRESCGGWPQLSAEVVQRTCRVLRVREAERDELGAEALAGDRQDEV